MGDEDLSRIEHRIQRVENRQDKQETMMSDTVERVRDLSISIARQDERLLSIDRTVNSIYEAQQRREELDKKHREADSTREVDQLQKQREMEQKLQQQRMIWAAGAILALSLLIINIIVAL